MKKSIVSAGSQGRLLVGFIAIVTAPALFLIDAIIAWQRGWVAESRLDVIIIFAAVLGFLGACGAILFGRTRRGLRGVASQLTLLMIVVAVSWLAAEVVVGAMFKGAGFHTRTPGFKNITEPMPGVMPGITDRAVFSINSRGIRGPEFPPRQSAFRILCVGGSTTECGYLDDREAWPNLLMEHLNRQWAQEGASRRVWVGGIGIGGWDTEKHLIFVRSSPMIREVDCLVFLVGINDFQWFLQGGPTPDPVPGPVWSRSPILKKARNYWHRDPPVAYEDNAGQAYVERRRRRQAMQLIDELPEMDTALDAYRRRITAIIEACRDKSVTPVFITQPVLWDEKMTDQAEALLWFGWLDDYRCLTPRRLRQGMERYNETLRQTCREMNVSWIDLAALHGNESLFFDDCHFNVAGAREVANVTATWFIQNKARVFLADADIEVED